MTSFDSIEDTAQKLEDAGYIPSREIATVVFLAAAAQKPILVEGPAQPSGSRGAATQGCCRTNRAAH